MKSNLFFRRLLLLWVFAFSTTLWGQTTTFFNFTSSYVVPPAAGWTSAGSASGGSYLKLSPGSVTSSEYDSSNNVVFKYDIAAFGSGTSGSLTKLIFLNSSDDVISEFTLTSANSSTYIPSTLNVGSINTKFKVKIEGYGTGANGGTNKGTRLQKYSLTGDVVSTGPTITATPSSLSGFTYIESSGPSDQQFFSVNGSNLTNDITATAPANFELSKTTGSGFADVLTFTQTGGSVASTIVYARMKAGLAPTTYSGNIALSSTDAPTVNIALSGTVTPMPVKPVITTPVVQTGAVGVAYTYQIVASESPTSYALSAGALIAGLSLNTTTGIISGTPTAAGNSTVNITATNAAGTSDPATIDFTIAKGTQTLTGFEDLTKYLSDPDFTLPATADNSGLVITYSSSNPSVATVSENIVDIVGLGTSTINATQDGDANWNAFGSEILLTVIEDLVPYSGSGNFVKINSVGDLTDGYYVVTNETAEFLMTNVNEGFFESEAVTPISEVISDPSVNNVWLITTDGSGKTIYNEVTSKYVGWASGNAASAEDLPADTNRWTFTYTSGKFNVNNVASPARQLSYNSGAPRFAAYANAGQQELQLFKLVPRTSTTWDGTAWSNGEPDANSNAVIAEDYSGPAIVAATLTIEATKTFTVNSSAKTGDVINEGNIVLADNASFIQTSAGNYFGTGTFTVNRESISPLNKYAFWSSPVINQNMFDIFTGYTAAYVMTYNTATNFYDTLTNPATAAPGVGYSIKTPATAPTATFAGAPNNGAISVALSTSADQFNLVGNPYPSNLDLAAFYTLNNANIGSTLWFWDNTGGTVTTQTGSTANNFGYATYNASSKTWLKAPSGATAPTENYVKIGHGFIVEALSNTLTFDNTLRVANAGVNLNKNAASMTGEGKYWLTLSTSYNANVTQAITYQNDASNDLDTYDSRAIGLGSDAFYSFAGAEKVVIQGKAPFNTDDIVQLGNKHFENGTFKIELTQKEGLFADGQAIYLKDNLLGTEVNLQDGAYLFSSNAGEFSTRFEVVYSKSVLGTGSGAKTSFTVYRNGDDFIVDSPSKISSVEVYDASGKLVRSLRSSGNKETVSDLPRGVFIMKIKTASETVTKKVIK